MEYLFRPIHIRCVLFSERWRFKVRCTRFLILFLLNPIVCVHTRLIYSSTVRMYLEGPGSSFRFPRIGSLSISLSLSVLLLYTLITSISLLYNLVLFSHVEIESYLTVLVS